MNRQKRISYDSRAAVENRSEMATNGVDSVAVPTGATLGQAAEPYRGDGLAMADAQKAPMSAGRVSKLRSPMGSVIQAVCCGSINAPSVATRMCRRACWPVPCGLESQTLGTADPRATIRAQPANRHLPLSVVRSTGRGSAAVIRNARSEITIPIEKALLVIR